MNAVLGIETATDVCSVGLSRAGSLVGVLSIRESRKHSEMLVPLIQSLLEESGCDREDLVAIVLSSGPGSYTGLRIGASTAKGIAAGLGIDLIAVPTLDALAVGALADAPVADAAPSSRLGALVSLLPARQSEVYARVYMEEGGELTPTAPAEAVELSALVGHMSETFGDQWVLAAPAPDRWQHALPAAVRTVEVAASAAHVLNAATRHGHRVDAETFEPYYIKPFIARKPGKSAFDRLVF